MKTMGAACFFISQLLANRQNYIAVALLIRGFAQNIGLILQQILILTQLYSRQKKWRRTMRLKPFKFRKLDQVKTVCCECGAVLKEGQTQGGLVSHGYCSRCAGVIMRFIEGYEAKNARAKA